MGDPVDLTKVSAEEWLARYAPNAAAARANRAEPMWGSAPAASACTSGSCAACGESEVVLDRAAWDLPLGGEECTTCSSVDYDAIRERLRAEASSAPAHPEGGTAQ